MSQHTPRGYGPTAPPGLLPLFAEPYRLSRLPGGVQGAQPTEVNMIKRKLGAAALAAGLLLGSGALTACENEDRKDVEEIKDDVGREVDKLEDEVDNNN